MSNPSANQSANLSEGLLRQRRNLIVVSIALLLVTFADVRAEKVSLFGAELRIGRPDVLVAFAWIVWAYFLVRFHQYLSDAGDLGIKAEFLKRRLQYARRFAELKPIRDEMGQQYDQVELRRVDRRKWEVRVSDYEPREGRVTERTSAAVSLVRIQLWSARAWAHQMLMTSRLTDYVLPYILAFAAPVVSVWKRILI